MTISLCLLQEEQLVRKSLSNVCPSIRATLKNILSTTCGLFALLAFTTLPLPAADLLYATMSLGTVVTFDVSSGNATTIANSKTLFASGLNQPRGLAFDSSGNLFVANYGNNTVSKITPGGVVSTFVSGGMINPTGLAFDTAGNLYAASYSNTVSKITPGGVVSTFASGLVGPEGLTFDSSGNLYAANAFSNSVSKISPGGTVSPFASGSMDHPYGVTLDTSNNLYVANVSNFTATKFDSSGNLLFTFSTGSDSPMFLVGPITVPEPSTYALGAIAAGVMGAIARRRKTRQSA